MHPKGILCWLLRPAQIAVVSSGVKPDQSAWRCAAGVPLTTATLAAGQTEAVQERLRAAATAGAWLLLQVRRLRVLLQEMWQRVLHVQLRLHAPVGA